MYKLLDDYGCYYTGFLTAKLNMKFDSNTKFQELSEDDQATIIHEYIHYIQDISSTRGALTFNFVVDSLKMAFTILSNSNQVIHLPIRYSEELDLNGYLAYEFCSYCRGSTEPFKKINHINRITCENEEIFSILYDAYPQHVPKEMVDNYHRICVYYDDNEHPYFLGSYCIAECMAYLIENQVFRSIERKNEIPYNLCELIAEQICSDIQISKILLVAICELSLMHENSGEMFYKILSELNNKKLCFSNVDEFENHFIPRTTHLFKPLNKLLKKALTSIDFLYPESIMKTTNDYAKKCFLSGMKKRKSGLFIAKMLEKTGADRDREIESWMNSLGMPLLILNTYEAFSVEGVELLDYLAPLALYDLFFDNKKECFSFFTCKEQAFPLFDEKNCKECPWKQVEKESLCPFSLYFHRFSINPDSISKD